jgi:hypothetical protein
MTSIQDRLVRLKEKRRFLNWFLGQRLIQSLTDDGLEIYARDGTLPNPIPDRASNFDRLDQKSILKLWEEEKRDFGHRSRDDLRFYAEKGYWPEQGMRPHYYTQDGHWFVGWKLQPQREDQRERS